MSEQRNDMNEVLAFGRLGVDDNHKGIILVSRPGSLLGLVAFPGDNQNQRTWQHGMLPYPVCSLCP